MPCYDGSREDARIDRETAKKVEAVLCGAVRAFGFDSVLCLIDDFRLDGTATWAQMKMGNPKPIGGYWIRFFLRDAHTKRIQWEVLPAQVDYANIQSYLRKTVVLRERIA